MTQVHVDATLADDARRERLFQGDIFHFGAASAVLDMCAFADELAATAFAGHDPQTAQFALPVAEFVAIVAQLKTTFTNHAETHRIMQAILSDMGCDMDDTYFDVPRLRVVTADNYLTAGVGYAYKPHRDTWYGSPSAQVNWWLPVHDLVPERSLSLFPTLFATAVTNSSAEFDYGVWTTVDRHQATTMVAADTRRHPLPLESIDRAADLRLVGRRASLIQFSGAHLHETVPNTSDRTRFSIDFRTVNLADLRQGNGAPNVDGQAKGSTLGDFLRAADFARFPTDLIPTSSPRS